MLWVIHKCNKTYRPQGTCGIENQKRSEPAELDPNVVRIGSEKYLNNIKIIK